MKNKSLYLLLAAVLLPVFVSSCALFGNNGSDELAIIGGGAVAGKDYVLGLKPSEGARDYFSDISEGRPIETVRRTDEKESKSGVRFVSNGGILIPPGVTISFENHGYCMDPHLPAPKAGEEFQLVPMNRLIPDELQGTYKNLIAQEGAGNSAVRANMQHLVWALRTAGTDAAYANNLTSQEKQILNQCSNGLFESFHEREKISNKLINDLLSMADSVLNVSIGGVTYKASDLLDPDIANKKIEEHLNQLIDLSEFLPVENLGLNFGEIVPGIFTDVRGTGYLSYHARIANSTSQPFIFYPSDYVGQVGSPAKRSGLFAAADSSMRQRVTGMNQNEVNVEDQRQGRTEERNTTPSTSNKRSFGEAMGLPQSEDDALKYLLGETSDTVYQHFVSGSIVYGFVEGGSPGYLKLLNDTETKLKSGKVVKGKFGTPLDYGFGVFVGDFSTSIATGQWDAAADATEKYVLDKTLGTVKTLYNIGYLAGAWIFDLTH